MNIPDWLLISRSIKGQLEAVKAVAAIHKNVLKLEKLVHDLSDAVEESKEDIKAEIDTVYGNCRVALHIQDKYLHFGLLKNHAIFVRMPAELIADLQLPAVPERTENVVYSCTWGCSWRNTRPSKRMTRCAFTG